MYNYGFYGRHYVEGIIIYGPLFKFNAISKVSISIDNASLMSRFFTLKYSMTEEGQKEMFNQLYGGIYMLISLKILIFH